MGKMTFLKDLKIKEIEVFVRSMLAEWHPVNNNPNCKLEIIGNTLVDVHIKGIKMDYNLYSDDNGEGCEERAAVEITGYNLNNPNPVEETFYYELFWDCEDGELWAVEEMSEEMYNKYGKE